MGTTTRTKLPPVSPEEGDIFRWRVWPLADYRRWSWIVPLGILAVGGGVWHLGGGLLLAAALSTGLVATLWQFFVPVVYEIGPRGLRRQALGRVRIVPWRLVRAYQLRASGIVLYANHEPTKVDLFRSVFVPYPADEDEMLCAVKQRLAHASEVPQ
jgi:hypothetical protein